MAASTDSTCSFKFGPEWIRMLSQPSGGQTPQSSPQATIPPRKFPLSKHRYGKEELIAIYEQTFYGDSVSPFGSPMSPVCEGIFVEKGRTPRSLIPMTDEEQRQLAFNRAPSRGRGRGLATTPWTPSRSIGNPQPQTARSWRSPEKPNSGLHFDSWRKSIDDKVPEWADEKVHEENENVGTFDGKGSFLTGEIRRSEIASAHIGSGPSFMQRSQSNLEKGRQEQPPSRDLHNSPLVDKTLPDIFPSMKSLNSPSHPMGVAVERQRNGVLHHASNPPLRAETSSTITSGVPTGSVGTSMSMMSGAVAEMKQKFPPEFHLTGLTNHHQEEPKPVLPGTQWNAGRDLAQASLWFYKDPRGIIQGPFTSSDMLDWCSQGYFPNDLECCRAIDLVFNPLGLLIKTWNGELPFFNPSRMPPFTTSLTASPPVQSPAKIPTPFGMGMNPLSVMMMDMQKSSQHVPAFNTTVEDMLAEQESLFFKNQSNSAFGIAPSRSNGEHFAQPLISKVTTLTSDERPPIIPSQALSPRVIQNSAQDIPESIGRLLSNGSSLPSALPNLKGQSDGWLDDEPEPVKVERTQEILIKNSFHIESQPSHAVKGDSPSDKNSWLLRNNERNVEVQPKADEVEEQAEKESQPTPVAKQSKTEVSKVETKKGEKFEKVERKDKKKNKEKKVKETRPSEEEIKNAAPPPPKDDASPVEAEEDDWGDDEFSDYRNVVVPAPAPAVSAWGKPSEKTASQSLHEIQRIEEERARTEMQKKRREAVKNGHQSEAKTWANAIAPTKSFDQIQQEQQSKSSSPQPKAAPAAPLSAASIVANGNSPPVKQAIKISKTVVASTLITSIGSQVQTENNNEPPELVPEVSNNEQLLIDWCAQITKGINSYLDMPTVVSILKDVDSEAEIEDYVSQFFGDKIKEPRQFARQFMQKRSKLNVGSASAQPKQSEWCTTGGNKKKKNGKK